MTTWRDQLGSTLRPDDVGREVTLAGWVARRRDLGGLVFVDLRDQGGVVQVVINPDTAPAAAETAHQLRNEFVIRVRGAVVKRAPETGQPGDRDGRDRAAGDRAGDPLALDAAAVPARRRGRRRERPHAPPLARPAPRQAAAQHPPARPDGRPDPPHDGGGRLRRHPDADPLEADARGRARLPRAGAPAARQVLRAAAVAADREAAARDRRLRALLPDRDLLPGRGSPRRPRAGDHPARRRDGVPRPGVPVRADGDR